MWAERQQLLLWIFMTEYLIGHSMGTKCYVCGHNSSVAEKCLDEYPVGIREEDKQDCSKSKEEGCIKSKFIDVEQNQIVTRGCAPEVGMTHIENDCKTTEVAENHVFFCHCSGDYCNNSTRNSANWLLTLLSIPVCFLGKHLLRPRCLVRL
ncbi:uncharacterized protein [Watersipora subatra]|uniref:uncharacterized protein n=1 Tax=Watersipora subatra TaxID=2589382 RepID=UPI00355C944A